MKIDAEIQSLFKKVMVALGAPLMEVELTEEMLCSLLEMSIEDYAERVQNWIIENQWATLYGKNLSNADLAHALSVRTLDMSRDFSYWFSREVGLQQRGSWELKKDFITIEKGKQNYIIPAGREINSVMFVNPPTTTAALYANYGGLDTLGFAGAGFGGTSAGGSYGPVGGFYIAQSADIAYMATDLAYKTRLLRGDLTYKVTAGPEGTRILHLYSNPGSKFSFGGDSLNGMLSLVGSNVYYTYYDTNESNVDECRKLNPEVVLSPDQIPLAKMDYAFLNEPTKTIVRKILIAKAKQSLAMVRGKFSGRVSIPEAELTMDYQMLLTQSEKEYDNAIKELDERLLRMSPYEQMKKQAELVDNTIKVLAGKPLKPTVC